LIVCILWSMLSVESYAQDNVSINWSMDSGETGLTKANYFQRTSTSTQLNTFLFPQIQVGNTRDSLLKKQSFGRSAWRAARIIFCGELVTMAFFASMPESFSNWNKNFYQDALTHWKNAFTMPPKIDNDPVMVNYIQHPLAGAIYYNGVRSQGASRGQSLFFAFAESTFFEYFIESVAERPSIQDLIITPLAGSVIGELQHQGTLLMRRKGFNFVERILVFIINPMYVIFNGYKIKTPTYKY
jgi:hypothetical protein